MAAWIYASVLSVPVRRCLFPQPRSRALYTYLELRRVSANDRLDLFAVLEKDKAWHSADTDLRRDLALLIDIDLVEADLLASRRLGDLLKDRADHLAGTTPRSPKVDHNNLVTTGHLLELVVGGNHLHTHPS